MDTTRRQTVSYRRLKPARTYTNRYKTLVYTKEKCHEKYLLPRGKLLYIRMKTIYSVFVDYIQSTCKLYISDL